MRLGVSALVTVGLLFGAVVSGAQIVHGGYELPAIGGAGYATFTAGVNGSGIPGWLVTSGSVDLVANSFYPAFQGNQSLDLDGDHPGSIQQTFATVIGQQYSINFAYANNPYKGSIPTVSANVAVLNSSNAQIFSQTISHNTSTVGAMNYNLFSNVFTANSASSTLVFTSLDPFIQGGGIALDAVSVTPAAPTSATPEFGSVVSLGGLLLAGGAGIWVKRRRNK